MKYIVNYLRDNRQRMKWKGYFYFTVRVLVNDIYIYLLSIPGLRTQYIR